jgi:hypothetical protein
MMAAGGMYADDIAAALRLRLEQVQELLKQSSRPRDDTTQR